MNLQFYNFTIFKRLIFFSVFISWFLVWGNAMAADIHICDTTVCGQTPGDGSTWSNAFDDLPATLVRGDTYYIADGDYNTKTFNTAVSGNTTITIKKATVAEHGTDEGWDNAYGVGQAVFTATSATGMNFSTDYWIIDGSTRATETTGYGFKVIGQAVASSNIYAFYTDNADYLQFKYIEVTSPNTPIANNCIGDGSCTAKGFRIANSSNITIEYTYIHDVALPIMHVLGGDDFIYRYSVAERNDSCGIGVAGCTVNAHSESVVVGYGTRNRMYFYNNKFIDIEGTGVISFENQVTASNIYIHNNVSYYTTGSDRVGLGNGWFTCTNSNTFCSSVYIYNNTIVNFPSITARIDEGTAGAATSDWIIKNNLWFCNTGSCGTVVNDADEVMTYDNNWYGGVSYTAGEAGAINGTTENPFTNSATYDFTLKEGATPINEGTDLSAIIPSLDYAGHDRAAPWDIGAYEYTGAADVIAPASPTGLAVQ